MAKNSASSATSPALPLMSSAPTSLPSEQTVDIQAYRESKDGLNLVACIRDWYTKSKTERTAKQLQWVQNMAMFYGNQWLERTRSFSPEGYANKLYMPRKLPYREHRTINRTRSFVRTELSKFVSKSPTAMVVPATADEEDLRAAYAGEQVWESVSTNRHLQSHFKRAQWWTVVTGNGFIKTYWDNSCIDLKNGIQGDIRFGHVTPFHLYVPDLREQDIEDQPYIINAYTKPVEWCRTYYAEELQGITLQPSVTSANQIIEGHYLNLSGSREPDSCILYEAWIKPGATKLLPNGGVVILIDQTLVSVIADGFPYDHGQYPFTHFEHIPTGTFYADSPLVDTNQLQREFNQLRSEISEDGRRMARPQLTAVQGSIVPSKITNEPGQIILYRPGTPAPQPIPLAPLPQYYLDQQDRILADWEDITGQHDATNGSAPSGVTAGTAINYLQEQDDSFLSTEYESVEEGWERIAGQTIQLFVQYVDQERKIKTTGSDGIFDVLVLTGDQLRTGTDIRMEKGSSISQSQAGRQAQIQSMFQIGLLDAQTSLRLLEIGGVNKVLDILNVAQRKAQRENIKMKMLTSSQIMQHEMLWNAQQMEQMQQQAQMAQLNAMLAPAPAPAGLGAASSTPPSGVDGAGAPPPSVPGAAPIPAPGTPPEMGAPQDGTMPAAAPTDMSGDPTGNDPTALAPSNPMGPPSAPNGPPPVVPVDDFDIHQIHIEEHNKYRMSQGYEALPPEIKLQFELHVKLHEEAQMKGQLQQFLGMIPGAEAVTPAGAHVESVPQSMTQGAQPVQSAPQPGAGGTMSGNGQVPDTTSQPGGQ